MKCRLVLKAWGGATASVLLSHTMRASDRCKRMIAGLVRLVMEVSGRTRTSESISMTETIAVSNHMLTGISSCMMIESRLVIVIVLHMMMIRDVRTPLASNGAHHWLSMKHPFVGLAMGRMVVINMAMAILRTHVTVARS